MNATTHSALFVALMLLVASAIGCGATDIERPEAQLHGSTETALGGKSDTGFATAEDYYRQFVYQVDPTGGTWDTGEPQWVYYLATPGHHAIPDSLDWFGLDVYLMADGTAWVRYAEWTRIGGGQSELVAEAIVKSSWQVAEDQLVVSGIGAGVATSHGGQDAVLFSLTTNFTSPGVHGQSVVLQRAHGTYRVELIERDFAAQ